MIRETLSQFSASASEAVAIAGPATVDSVAHGNPTAIVVGSAFTVINSIYTELGDLVERINNAKALERGETLIDNMPSPLTPFTEESPSTA